MPTLRINEKLDRIFEAKQPIIVIYGGRDSGKSIGIGDWLTMTMATEGTDVLCLREFHDSIEDSVHKVFKSAIEERLKLPVVTQKNPYGWEIQKTKIIAPNGASTTYKGANRNPDSIQSAQNFLRCWFEEAHRASQDSIDKLLPTIIRNKGAKVIFTANPQSSADPFSKRFIVPYLDKLNRDGIYEDELHLIIKINYRDNPWYWESDAELLRLHDYNTMSRARYDWIWEGAFNDEVDDSIIKPEWFDAAIDLHLDPRFERAMRPLGAKKIAHDPSGKGNDAKGLAVRHGSIITHVEARDFGDVDEGCDWATGEAIKQACDWFIWDADGMGYGLKSQVSTNLKGTRVQWHSFSGALSGSGQDNAAKQFLKDDDQQKGDHKTYADYFYNNRSQYYGTLAAKFFNSYKARERGEYVDPCDMISIAKSGCPDILSLRSELCRIPSKPNGRGMLQIMSKQDMLKLEIKSPNMADAVMMSEWTPPTRAKETTDYGTIPTAGFKW